MNTTTNRPFQSVIVALVVIGLLALALSGYLSPLARIVLSPLVTAQTWVATRYTAIQNSINAPQDLARLQQRNLELEAEVSRLQSEIIDLKQQIGETRVLSALVDFARTHTENKYIGAEVIGRDPSPFLQYVLINRGSDSGMRRGMPVVTQQGLVGRVAAVTAAAARVQLITDAASSINVKLEPSGAEAVLVGSVTGEVSLQMIPQTASVQVGDVILTSGLGGNYPANILIGQVTGVRSRDYDLFKTATVQPLVDFSQMEIVLIITNFRPIDVSPLVPTPAAP